MEFNTFCSTKVVYLIVSVQNTTNSLSRVHIVHLSIYIYMHLQVLNGWACTEELNIFNVI